MFDQRLEERLGMMDRNLHTEADHDVQMEEISPEGRCRLTVYLKAPSILFIRLEKHKLDYFTNKKCADYILFEKRRQGWILHVFELKRTVKETTWEEIIKYQFQGAVQNAMAIAGFLGIPISYQQTRFYTAYRNDRINCISDPVKQRMRMHNSRGQISNRNTSAQREWNTDRVELDFLGKAEYIHKKIQLDTETGEGEYQMD
ncbi:MAG: hypothetical protein NC180_03485 [Muribaculaceae bacterium]|nr:hypothetical protein [Roseburia sp.]MCM1431244.1 hypothetical protein [Muribaculaceae bacterium]MCM1492270.1 hypothetical protein [Muribaculaceae bacterium]